MKKRNKLYPPNPLPCIATTTDHSSMNRAPQIALSVNAAEITFPLKYQPY